MTDNSIVLPSIANEKTISIRRECTVTKTRRCSVTDGNIRRTVTNTQEQKMKQLNDFSDSKLCKITTTREYTVSDSKEFKRFDDESSEKVTNTKHGMYTETKECKYAHTPDTKNYEYK